MGNILTGDQYISIDGKLTEIKRQMRQKGGCPHDPKALDDALQLIVDGEFAKLKDIGKSSILRLLVGTISIPAQKKKFAASDHFVFHDKLNIGWMNQNFKNWFLGKTEEAHAESSLSSWELTKNSLDEAIRMEIGKEKEEIFLSEIAHLLSLQSRGEAGALLINGYANIFYVRDVENTLRTVFVNWYARYRDWSVRALEVSGPGEWGAGDRFFSRNSS